MTNDPTYDRVVKVRMWIAFARPHDRANLEYLDERLRRWPKNFLRDNATLADDAEAWMHEHTKSRKACLEDNQ